GGPRSFADGPAVVTEQSATAVVQFDERGLLDGGDGGPGVRDREQRGHAGAMAVHPEEWERGELWSGGGFRGRVERVTTAGRVGDIGVHLGVHGADADVAVDHGGAEGLCAGGVQHVREHHDQQGDGAGDGHDDAVWVHVDGDGAGPDVFVDGRG